MLHLQLAVVVLCALIVPNSSGWSVLCYKVLQRGGCIFRSVHLGAILRPAVAHGVAGARECARSGGGFARKYGVCLAMLPLICSRAIRRGLGTFLLGGWFVWLALRDGTGDMADIVDVRGVCWKLAA